MYFFFFVTNESFEYETTTLEKEKGEEHGDFCVN
jgi:hypothetical protein